MSNEDWQVPGHVKKIKRPFIDAMVVKPGIFNVYDFKFRNLCIGMPKKCLFDLPKSDKDDESKIAGFASEPSEEWAKIIFDDGTYLSIRQDQVLAVYYGTRKEGD